MEFNYKEVNRLIRERRSVYQNEYTGGEIDKEIIQQMLENANWAPTHKMTEPWRFVVFRGEGLKKLAQFQAECYKQVAGKDGTFKEDRYQNLLTKPLTSSCVIAIGMKRDEKKRVPEVEELGAVFCGIQNMYLTATAYGIGCFLSTGGITYFEEAKEFFGLAKEDKLIGFLNIGAVKKVDREGKRNPIDSKTKWED